MFKALKAISFSGLLAGIGFSAAAEEVALQIPPAKSDYFHSGVVQEVGISWQYQGANLLPIMRSHTGARDFVKRHDDNSAKTDENAIANRAAALHQEQFSYYCLAVKADYKHREATTTIGIVPALIGPFDEPDLSHPDTKSLFNTPTVPTWVVIEKNKHSSDGWEFKGRIIQPKKGLYNLVPPSDPSEDYVTSGFDDKRGRLVKLIEFKVKGTTLGFCPSS